MTGPMRRLGTLLVALLLLVPPSAPAAAQETPSVRLTLVSQTPWNSLDRRELTVRIRAVNTGTEPVGDLSIGLTLWEPVLSRTAFEDSLVADPTTAVVQAETFRREASIGGGEARDFELHMDLTSPGVSTTRSDVYPLKVDLRSGLTSVAALRIPVVFLVKRPVTPLDLAWTFVLHEPIGFSPDGVFRSPALERSLAPGGQLAGELAALVALALDPRPTPVDVAVSPVLLTQLLRMRDGYSVIERGETHEVSAGKGGAAAAATAIAQLRRIATSDEVELSALPFSAPRLAALAAGGLAHDLDAQLRRGRELVATALGRQPSISLLRPPDSSLDQASLEGLVARGVRTLLLDPTSVRPTPQPLGFAAPAVVSLEADTGTACGVVSDPSVEALLDSPIIGEDPVRAARAVLGELAVIWLEQPSRARSLAIVLPEGFTAPSAFFGPLVRAISHAPWLAPRSATDLAQDPRFTPSEPSKLVPSSDLFSRAYVDEIRADRRRLETYDPMLVRESAEPARLDGLILLAESGQFVGNEAPGRRFLGSVRDEIAHVFDAVHPDPDQTVTLTSSAGGSIPVRVTNANDFPVHVILRLVSPHLRSPDIDGVLDPHATITLNFDVRLNTTGRFPVDVQVVSPSGRVVNEATLIVRSTGFNRIALLITIAAAAVLLLLWARRFLPRRTS
jgi:hypothetical protein